MSHRLNEIGHGTRPVPCTHRRRGQTRKFTFVDKILNALLLANAKITDGTPVIAGLSEHISINEMVKILFECLDQEPLNSSIRLTSPFGVRHRAADTSLAEEMLGWRPQYKVKEGFAETIEWYVANREFDCVMGI